MSYEVTKDLQKPLLDALDKLRVPLETLSIIALADEFYTKDERVNLYAQYKELCNADGIAFEELMNAGPKDKLGFEERVKEFGEAAAHEQMEPKMVALEKRQAALRALSKFEAEHALLVRLWEQKLKSGNRN